MEDRRTELSKKIQAILAQLETSIAQLEINKIEVRREYDEELKRSREEFEKRLAVPLSVLRSIASRASAS